MVATRSGKLAVNRRPEPSIEQTRQSLMSQLAFAPAAPPSEPVATLGGPIAHVPIASFVHEQGRANGGDAATLVRHLENMGILDSATLLSRLGGASRRTLALRMIAHQDDSLSETVVRVLVHRWLSQADLLRTGLSLESARLLVLHGTDNVQALARYAEPAARHRLLLELAVVANQSGDRLPTLVQLNHSIDQARGLPASLAT